MTETSEGSSMFHSCQMNECCWNAKEELYDLIE